MAAFFKEQFPDGPHAYVEVRDGAEYVKLQDLIDYASENHIDPRHISITPESNRYEGPEGPDNYLGLAYDR